MLLIDTRSTFDRYRCKRLQFWAHGFCHSCSYGSIPGSGCNESFNATQRNKEICNKERCEIEQISVKSLSILYLTNLVILSIYLNYINKFNSRRHHRQPFQTAPLTRAELAFGRFVQFPTSNDWSVGPAKSNQSNQSNPIKHRSSQVKSNLKHQMVDPSSQIKSIKPNQTTIQSNQISQTQSKNDWSSLKPKCWAGAWSFPFHLNDRIPRELDVQFSTSNNRSIQFYPNQSSTNQASIQVHGVSPFIWTIESRENLTDHERPSGEHEGSFLYVEVRLCY